VRGVTLADWLARCERLHPKSMELTLDRVAAVRATLGIAFDVPVVVVAGTNGKGSTCAFLRAGIEAAGLSAHVFTSPHLVRFNERIRIAGRLIEDEAVTTLDFGRGDDPYKQLWTNTRQQRIGVMLCNSLRADGLAEIVRHWGGQARRAILAMRRAKG